MPNISARVVTRPYNQICHLNVTWSRLNGHNFALFLCAALMIFIYYLKHRYRRGELMRTFDYDLAAVVKAQDGTLIKSQVLCYKYAFCG